MSHEFLCDFHARWLLRGFGLELPGTHPVYRLYAELEEGCLVLMEEEQLTREEFDRAFRVGKAAQLAVMQFLGGRYASN